MATQRLCIGLTGGIASGKSTAAGRFLELGVPVIDADESARTVVRPGSAGLERVIHHFGRKMLTTSGELDRRALRDIIFASEDRRRELESILHPLIRSDMDVKAMRSIGPYVVLAVPLLVEKGQHDRVDRILVVDVESQIQLQRLIARDGVTEAEAKAALAAQASRETRLAAADDVLRNSGSVHDLRHLVDQLHQRYLSLSEHFAVREGRLT